MIDINELAKGRIENIEVIRNPEAVELRFHREIVKSYLSYIAFASFFILLTFIL